MFPTVQVNKNAVKNAIKFSISILFSRIFVLFKFLFCFGWAKIKSFSYAKLFIAFQRNQKKIHTKTFLFSIDLSLFLFLTIYVRVYCIRFVNLQCYHYYAIFFLAHFVVLFWKNIFLHKFEFIYFAFLWSILN